MRKSGLFFISGCLLAVGLNGPTLQAADGAIPVWEPMTITQSGRYVVTRNITSAVNPVITINADDVLLDLNGFKIEGDANIFAADVLLVAGNGVTIQNGSVQGGGAAVRMSLGTTRFSLNNLSLSGGRTGVAASASASLGLIENNRIGGVTDGVTVSGSSVQVRKNVISADSQGINVTNCDSCVIADNTVQSATSAGILIDLGAGNQVLRNTVSNCGVGIRVSQGGYHQIEGNVTTKNTSYGLFFRNTSFDNVYRGNTARNNAGSGCTGGSPTASFCNEGTGNSSQGDNFLPLQQ